jgi:hypothetical protein
MPNELTLQNTLPGLLFDKDMADLVGSFQIAEANGEPMLDRVPNREEKRFLVQRQDQLARVLRPISYADTDKDKAARMLALMFGGFPSLKNADAEGMVATYMLHLQELPLFALEKACNDINKNRVKGLDGDWPPTSPRVFEIAEKHLRSVVEEKIRYDKVLTIKKLIPPPVDEKKAKVMAEKLTGLRDSIDDDGLLEQIKEQDGVRRVAHSNEIIRRMWKGQGEEPLQSGGMLISPSLLESLKGKL